MLALISDPSGTTYDPALGSISDLSTGIGISQVLPGRGFPGGFTASPG